MRHWWIIAAVLAVTAVLHGQPAAAPSEWEKPASDLAEQIANILGPAQARLTIRNISSIPTDQIPAIRKLLIDDLKQHGITISGTESANAIKVTLSMDWLTNLWVAEVSEGNATQVTMTESGVVHTKGSSPSMQEKLVLSKTLYFSDAAFPERQLFPFTEPVLASVELKGGLFVARGEWIDYLTMSFVGWQGAKEFSTVRNGFHVRDPRIEMLPTMDNEGFTAYLPGQECTGTYSQPNDPTPHPGDGWSVNCHPSDDPWPIATGSSGASPLKAFFNASRNYFTGVVTPGIGIDLPPFYSAAWHPRAGGANALVITGIDGKVQLAENGSLKPVAGTRDWGSDFAVLNTTCSAGPVVVASGSGEALHDSLRAYTLPSLEAVPASAPLAVDGTVTAIWAAPDGKSVFAIVRNADNEYEVDRVTALCN